MAAMIISILQFLNFDFFFSGPWAEFAAKLNNSSFRVVFNEFQLSKVYIEELCISVTNDRWQS